MELRGPQTHCSESRWITRCTTNVKTIKLVKTRELRKGRPKSAVGALSVPYITIHLRGAGPEGAYGLNSWFSKTPLISLALMGKFCRQISNFRTVCFRNAISISAFSMQSARKAPPGESLQRSRERLWNTKTILRVPLISSGFTNVAVCKAAEESSFSC